MKIREKEFAMNLEDGLVDLSSKTPKNVRNVGENDRNKSVRRNNDLILQPQELYEQPLENFDQAFSDDLKVELDKKNY